MTIRAGARHDRSRVNFPAVGRSMHPLLYLLGWRARALGHMSEERNGWSPASAVLSAARRFRSAINAAGLRRLTHPTYRTHFGADDEPLVSRETRRQCGIPPRPGRDPVGHEDATQSRDWGAGCVRSPLTDPTMVSAAHTAPARACVGCESPPMTLSSTAYTAPARRSRQALECVCSRR
jgi:hypothetical protein